MVQTAKEYQREYFENEGYRIFDNMQDASEEFCKLFPRIISASVAVDSILNDTNCDWVVLNDGSVAVSPFVYQKRGQRKTLHTRITKCYLVQITDNDGNEVACEYIFASNQKEAAVAAAQLKNEYLNK